MESPLSRLLLISTLSFLSLWSYAQGPYASEAGTSGTSAIHKDSSVFVSWATECTVELGFLDITDKTQGYVSTGTTNSALGIPDGDILSLGDSGQAVLTFEGTIYNGPGPDFAIFENSFSDFFLELAKVFVSSDGNNYFEFPSHSLTPDSVDIGGFGTTDPTNLNNLAGKYRAQYGTPFDLDEMQGITGLDINNVVSIKLIDAVGSSNNQFASLDTAGNKIIDPFTTPFPSSGFDLDAVGLIHFNPVTGIASSNLQIKVYPNPCNGFINLELIEQGNCFIYNSSGQLLHEEHLERGHNTIQLETLPAGVYHINFQSQNDIKRVDFVKI